MNVIVALYSLREQEQTKISYGIGLVANYNNEKLSFDIDITKVHNDNVFHIPLYEILNKNIREKIYEKSVQFQKIREAINENYKYFFAVIKDYPLVSKNSLFLEDCYETAVKKDLKIDEKQYSEIYMLLNYEKIYNKFQGKNGYVTKEDVQNYLINYITEKCMQVIPKYLFVFIKDEKQRQLIFRGNYDRFYEKCIAAIYNFEDFQFLSKKFMKQNMYVIPIRERIIRYTGASIIDWGYDYFNYTSIEDRFSKEKKSKQGYLLILKKDEIDVENIDKFVSRYITFERVFHLRSYNYEKAYEDSNIVIYVIKK